MKQIRSALISVYHKDGLDDIVLKLKSLGVTIFSTGGTRTYLENLGISVKAVEDLTHYPSILGGRVKTLHPKVFGGILGRREVEEDVAQLESYEIPEIDLVVVDLYPFADTVASGATEQDIIEKIDIGGISLIRAAAKNFRDVLTVASKKQYPQLAALLESKNGYSDLEDRREFAREGFGISAEYDSTIYSWFLGDGHSSFHKSLRYGENPHQEGFYVGNFEEMFDQLHGKEISYNNMLDIDAAVNLMDDFREGPPTFAVLKHNNACGLAVRETLRQAYVDALAGDPISAYGSVLICNRPMDAETAKEVTKLFCEIVIAPDFDAEAIEILQEKKNRILLHQKSWALPEKTVRTALNGILVQQRDSSVEKESELNCKTKVKPTEQEIKDLLFASILVKHTKSNAIVLAKNQQLIASGTGQTSRVDALKQAINKAHMFNFDLNGAVMASDAFFPFPDCVEIAHEVGVHAVIQPGGSVRDQLSTDFCDSHEMTMVFTGRRHFKH